MNSKRVEFFFHETKHAIWIRWTEGPTNQLVMEERTFIPWATREQADRIIEQLNLVLRSEQ